MTGPTATTMPTMTPPTSITPSPSRQLTTNIKVTDPMMVAMDLRAKLMDPVTTVSTSVVSVVKRLSTSPVRTRSK